jgi:hypothetical protein
MPSASWLSGKLALLKGARSVDDTTRNQKEGEDEKDLPKEHNSPLSPAQMLAQGRDMWGAKQQDHKKKSVTSKIKSKFSALTGLRYKKQSNIVGATTYSNRSGDGKPATREAARHGPAGSDKDEVVKDGAKELRDPQSAVLSQRLHAFPPDQSKAVLGPAEKHATVVIDSSEETPSLRHEGTTEPDVYFPPVRERDMNTQLWPLARAPVDASNFAASPTRSGLASKALAIYPGGDGWQSAEKPATEKTLSSRLGEGLTNMHDSHVNNSPNRTATTRSDSDLRQGTVSSHVNNSPNRTTTTTPRDRPPFPDDTDAQPQGSTSFPASPAAALSSSGFEYSKLLVSKLNLSAITAGLELHNGTITRSFASPREKPSPPATAPPRNPRRKHSTGQTEGEDGESADTDMDTGGQRRGEDVKNESTKNGLGEVGVARMRKQAKVKQGEAMRGRKRGKSSEDGDTVGGRKEGREDGSRQKSNGYNGWNGWKEEEEEEEEEDRSEDLSNPPSEVAQGHPHVKSSLWSLSLLNEVCVCVSESVCVCVWVCLVVCELTLRPASYTLHPAPYTLHPTPYTRHPTSDT